MLLSASLNLLLIFIRQGIPGLPCRVRRTRYEFSSRCQVTRRPLYPAHTFTRSTLRIPCDNIYAPLQLTPNFLLRPSTARKDHWSTAPRKHRHRSSLVDGARLALRVMRDLLLGGCPRPNPERHLLHVLDVRRQSPFPFPYKALGNDVVCEATRVLPHSLSLAILVWNAG